MDLKKIGAFIALNRKAKGLTQQQLADKLGVTNKTVSRWETGKYMPDLSLLIPLSEELNISLNELLSGEKIESGLLQEKTETSLINTIEFSKKELKNEHAKISIILIISGLFISFSAFILFDTESSWCSFYSIFGIIIFIAGLFREINFRKLWHKILLSILSFMMILGLFCMIDYIGVITMNRVPIYRYLTTTEFKETKIITYDCPFYQVYRINADSIHEYYIVDTNNKYTSNTLPISPFNRQKSGIDNIIQYQNKYIGNNSNIGNLISQLPLSEYGYAFEINSKNNGLIVNYYTTDWYDNDDLYIHKSLIYNSISIFLLINNVQKITYNFSGSSYQITRETAEKLYPHFSQIKNKNIDKDMFNQYLESRMNDYDFISTQFPILFEKDKEKA